jgi:hypothetical protein
VQEVLYFYATILTIGSLIMAEYAKSTSFTFSIRNSSGVAVTSSSANITVQVSKDGGQFAVTTNNVSELLLANSTASGVYKIVLTDSEMTASNIVILPITTLPNVIPETIHIVTTNDLPGKVVGGGATAMSGVGVKSDLTMIGSSTTIEGLTFTQILSLLMAKMTGSRVYNSDDSVTYKNRTGDDILTLRKTTATSVDRTLG